MPRVSNAEKEKSHQRILEAAAALFRENGIETTSVADVMKAAGMTHGGFYRHFSGKEELVGAAFQTAVDGAVGSFERDTDPEAARAGYIQAYLSMEHVEKLGMGCPMAGLGSELARMEGAVKQDTASTVDRVTSLLRRGDDPQSGFAQLALLIGAVTLARLVNDASHAQSILEAAASGIERLE